MVKPDNYFEVPECYCVGETQNTLVNLDDGTLDYVHWCYLSADKIEVDSCLMGDVLVENQKGVYCFDGDHTQSPENNAQIECAGNLFILSFYLILKMFLKQFRTNFLCKIPDIFED